MNMAQSSALTLNWGPRSAVILSNTGHSVSVEPSTEVETALRSDRYTLQRCHFRVGSEHTLGSEQQAMETQCVHLKVSVAPGTHYGVVGVLWKLGQIWNPFLASIEERLPGQGEPSTEASVNFDLLFDGADNTKYWSYTGSLTTPPCAEEVDWYMLMNRLTLTQAQQDRFSDAIGWASAGGNFRPPQRLGERAVAGCVAPSFNGGCDCISVTYLDGTIIPARCGNHLGDAEPWCYVHERAESCGAGAAVIPSSYIEGMSFRYCPQSPLPDDTGVISVATAWRPAAPAAVALAAGLAWPLRA